MKTKSLIAALCVLLSVSCKKNASEDAKIQTQEQESIVLFERASSEPFVLSKKKSSFTRQTANGIQLNALPDPVDIKAYLGRSYQTNIAEIGTPDGVRFPIIDIEKLYTDHPDYYNPIHIGSTIPVTYSFSDFSRYQVKTNNTDKVNGGFSLNLGIFSIGAKHVYSNTFSSDIVNESKNVFGALDVIVRDNSHQILLSSNNIKKIKEDYLNATFLDEIYNTSASEFVNNYGGFYITNFISGGRAHAIFSGNYLSNTDTSVKESSMDNSINASFTFAEKADKSTFDLTLGNVNGSTIARANNITEFKTAVRTYGGSYGVTAITVPKSIDDVNLDLTSWAASLNDKSTHVLVDFNPGGLRPISDLFLQENIRYNLSQAISKNGESKPLLIPTIQARWQSMMSGGSGFVTIVLRTRFGDELQISTNATVLNFPDQTAMLNFARQEAQKKLPFYKVQVTAGPVDLSMGGSGNYQTSIAAIDEANMTKYYDAKHNMLYLLSQADGRKFAYSIHDDFLLDTYAIREWVNTLGTTQVTADELGTYTIVAL